jgi:hypothetical protein
MNLYYTAAMLRIYKDLAFLIKNSKFKITLTDAGRLRSLRALAWQSSKKRGNAEELQNFWINYVLMLE